MKESIHFVIKDVAPRLQMHFKYLINSYMILLSSSFIRKPAEVVLLKSSCIPRTILFVFNTLTYQEFSSRRRKSFNILISFTANHVKLFGENYTIQPLKVGNIWHISLLWGRNQSVCVVFKI